MSRERRRAGAGIKLLWGGARRTEVRQAGLWDWKEKGARERNGRIRTFSGNNSADNIGRCVATEFGGTCVLDVSVAGKWCKFFGCEFTGRSCAGGAVPPPHPLVIPLL